MRTQPADDNTIAKLRARRDALNEPCAKRYEALAKSLKPMEDEVIRIDKMLDALEPSDDERMMLGEA